MKNVSNIENKTIVFYDGDCGFCNSSVQFLLKKKKTEIYFIALQSDLAKETLSTYSIQIDLNTIYVLENNKVFDRSTAALILCKKLRGAYPVLFYIGFIFPKFFRDWVYDLIAKRRHKIKKGFCVLPNEKEKDYFLTD